MPSERVSIDVKCRTEKIILHNSKTDCIESISHSGCDCFRGIEFDFVRAAAASANRADKERRRLRQNYAAWFFGLLALIIVVGIGIFMGVRSGVPMQRTILNLVGLGPAGIDVDNFRDDVISVNITRADPQKDPKAGSDSIRRNAFDVKEQTTSLQIRRISQDHSF